MALKLGICQLKVSGDKRVNLTNAEAAITRAAGAGAQMIALPEMFNCPYQQEYFSQFAEEAPTGETLRLLAGLARQLNCYIIGGSIPERSGAKVYNTSFVFGRDGQILARHRKIHLFDIEIPGQICFKESAVLQPGEAVTWFDTDYGRCGVVICYDLRFPELFRLMVDAGVQLVFIPAAFNMTTGPAHWEILMRARAIDNQVHIVGVSPARDTTAGYIAYGHSIVVDPWGSVLWQAAVDETVNVVTIDQQKTREVREGLPLLAHRRPDLYQVTRNRELD